MAIVSIFDEACENDAGNKSISMRSKPKDKPLLEACVGSQEKGQWLVEARRTSVRMAQYITSGVVVNNTPPPILAVMPYGSANEVAREINEEGSHVKFQYKKAKKKKWR